MKRRVEKCFLVHDINIYSSILYGISLEICVMLINSIHTFKTIHANVKSHNSLRELHNVVLFMQQTRHNLLKAYKHRDIE